MLTPAQKSAIVDKLSARINTPIVKTFLGKLALKMIVNEVDLLLSKALPPEITAIMGSAVDGLTPEEVAHLKEVLPPYILQNVHNVVLQAILPDVINVLVDVLAEALQTGVALPQGQVMMNNN